MNHIHTKGPWRSIQNFADEAEDERIFIEDKDGNTIAEITHVGLEWEEYEGNARLIAAAPEMLEALEAVHSWWMDTLPVNGEEDEMPAHVFDAVINALAKATGDPQGKETAR